MTYKLNKDPFITNFFLTKKISKVYFSRIITS